MIPLHVMDAIVTVILSALLVCSCSLPTKRDNTAVFHDVGMFGQSDAARVETVGDVTASGGLARQAQTYAASAGAGLDSHRKRSDVGIWRRWDAGRIPYVMEEDVPQDRVLLAMQHWHNNTCVRFVPHTNETLYVKIQMGRYCNSMIGRVDYLYMAVPYKGQYVQLTVACAAVVGNIVHELGHSLGLFHEHTRPDRDSYVRIISSNINTFQNLDFNIQSDNVNPSYGPYDLGSIMHYTLTTSSANGSNALELLVPYEGVVGQRAGLSQGDILKVNRMYECPTGAVALDFVPLSTSIAPKALPSAIVPNTTQVEHKSGQGPSPLWATSVWSKVIEATIPLLTPTPAPSIPTTASQSPGGQPNSNQTTLQSGSYIGLKMYNATDNRHFWIGCTASSCNVSNCPGNRFKQEKVQQNLCPEYIFSIIRTDGGSVIRVGDPVLLTQRGGWALDCWRVNPLCTVTRSCLGYTSVRIEPWLCPNQALVIRALNKGTGQPIMENDNVILDFQTTSDYYAGMMDTINCHQERLGSCERRYCYDPSVFLQARTGNTTLATIRNCRQIYTVFRIDVN